MSTNIARYLCSRGPVRQVFLQRASDLNSIEVKKKMADNLNYFSDKEVSKWLANIDASLLDKQKEEKQFRRQISRANSTPLRILLSPNPGK